MHLPAMNSVASAALLILRTHCPFQKAALSLSASRLWKANELPRFQTSDETRTLRIPTYPRRSVPTDKDGVSAVEHIIGSSSEYADPSTPLPKNTKPSRNMVRLIHSLCHVESIATDLAWDIVLRSLLQSASVSNLPRRCAPIPERFLSDFIQLAADEALHFSLWAMRLRALGSYYGALRVHDGTHLWTSAIETSHDIPGRLAIEHIIAEGRGLDIFAKQYNRFNSSNDRTSASLLQFIHDEEIAHVSSGRRWFSYFKAVELLPAEEVSVWEDDFLAGTEEIPDKVSESPTIVREVHHTSRFYFHGLLKPPFNHESRSRALLPRSWYEPLADPALRSTAMFSPAHG